LPASSPAASLVSVLAIWAEDALKLGAVKERPDRMAELVAPYAGRAPAYCAWLSWIIRFGNLYESRALFELLIAAVRRGDFAGIEGALWMGVHGLGQQQPSWAVELLGAYLIEGPHAFDLDTISRVVALELKDHPLTELAAQSSEGAPQAFLKLLVPYLLRVMGLIGTPSVGYPMVDRQTLLSFASHHRPRLRSR
jgi:hypothetical protein